MFICGCSSHWHRDTVKSILAVIDSFRHSKPQLGVNFIKFLKLFFWIKLPAMVPGATGNIVLSSFRHQPSVRPNVKTNKSIQQTFFLRHLDVKPSSQRRQQFLVQLDRYLASKLEEASIFLPNLFKGPFAVNP